ncbi:hypothetical protein FRC08_016275 [Ceratobasidium sp. 394]|nr:hypothetical protein FRC08_016275 [Ceratobasidium sp. 394]
MLHILLSHNPVFPFSLFCPRILPRAVSVAKYTYQICAYQHVTWCHKRASRQLHSLPTTTMSENGAEAETKPAAPLKPARKQVKPGEVERKETPQTGKEYSKYDWDCHESSR